MLAARSSARHLGRIDTVHSLRGLAALAVALYHFSWGNPGYYVPPVLKAACAKGWLGVEVFFVISGFRTRCGAPATGFHLRTSAVSYGNALYVWIHPISPLSL